MDRWANLGAEEQRKVTVEKEENTENWKAVRGFLEGSQKKDGRSGCGVLIKGVDSDKWITTSNFAVLLRTCAAMAAENVGAGVLTDVLDLLSGENSIGGRTVEGILYEVAWQ